MHARFLLAALLLLTNFACEKEIHEVRRHDVPQETLTISRDPNALPSRPLSS